MGKKKRPGGSDTLDFSAVSVGVIGRLMPEGWVKGSDNRNRLTAEDPDDLGAVWEVDLGASPVGYFRGGSGDDVILGGGLRNHYEGNGGVNRFQDYGGAEVRRPRANQPQRLLANDDTYAGLGKDGGFAWIADFGGGADTVDLRPLKSTEGEFGAFGLQGYGGDSPNSLWVAKKGEGDSENILIVIGQLGAVLGFGELDVPQSPARIETLVFDDVELGDEKVEALVEASAP